jgi:hypothetical protein
MDTQYESGNPGDEFEQLMLDSPTDHDEYVMNEDDCAPDPVDPFDMEYDR